MLLIGFHAVKGRIKVNSKTIEKIFISSSKNDKRVKELILLAKNHKIPVMNMDPKQINQLAKNKKNNGFLAFAEELNTPETMSDLIKFIDTGQAVLPTLIFLDGITDPRNLGAIFRCADAAGVAAIIAPLNHSAPLNELAVKTSSGATDSVFYLRVPNISRAIEYVQMKGYFVYGMDAQANKDIFSENLNFSIAFVFGDEGGGLKYRTKELCDELIKLPMHGLVESLNVSVACGISVFEVLRQKRSS